MPETPQNQIDRAHELEGDIRLRIRKLNEATRNNAAIGEREAIASEIAEKYAEMHLIHRQAQIPYEQAHGWAPRKGIHVSFFQELRLNDPESLQMVLSRVIDILADGVIDVLSRPVDVVSPQQNKTSKAVQNLLGE